MWVLIWLMDQWFNTFEQTWSLPVAKILPTSKELIVCIIPLLLNMDNYESSYI